LARGITRNGNPDADLPDDDAPVDVVAVRRDDALIDAIAGGGPVASDSSEQDQLALLLTNWRADIVAAPMPTGPLLDDVIAAIDASDTRSARSAARGTLRLLRPIAGAAAAIAMVIGGVTIFSYNAAPGDPLWSVKSVVFSQQADSTVAQIDTTSQLQEAERLIAAGDAEAAKNLLEGAADRAGGVRDADTRNELDAWRAKRRTREDRSHHPTDDDHNGRYRHHRSADDDHRTAGYRAGSTGFHDGARSRAAAGNPAPRCAASRTTAHVSAAAPHDDAHASTRDMAVPQP
jgi:hypothetical protein